MKKFYFIQIDFFNSDRSINKFICKIIEIDLITTSLQEITSNLIKENFRDINLNEITIKVKAFNNINF